MAFVYILENQKKEFYIGSSINLDRRIKEHINGYTFTTKRMKAFSLVFYQKYENIKDARKIELKLKKLKRHDYLAKIVKEGFIKIKPS